MSFVNKLGKMFTRSNKSETKQLKSKAPVKSPKEREILCSVCGRPTKLFGRELSESQAEKNYGVMSLKCGKCGSYFCITCIAQRISLMPDEPSRDISELSDYQIEMAIFHGVQKTAPCPKCKARRPKGPHDIIEKAALANRGYVAFCDYHVS